MHVQQNIKKLQQKKT